MLLLGNPRHYRHELDYRYLVDGRGSLPDAGGASSVSLVPEAHGVGQPALCPDRGGHGSLGGL